MAGKSKVVVSFDDLEKGESRDVTVASGSELIFEGISFEDVKVDIVDSDVILTDTDGSRIILTGSVSKPAPGCSRFERLTVIESFLKSKLIGGGPVNAVVMQRGTSP